MSSSAIQEVINEWHGMPESDQQQVLSFLRALKYQRSMQTIASTRHGNNPALKRMDGVFVFTGDIGDPQVDWLRVVRGEREDEIIRQMPEHSTRT